MRFLLQPAFLPHLWTLSGLGFSMTGLFFLFRGQEETAVRFILLPILVDFTDGTLARWLEVKERIPQVSGEALDMITDVIALNFVPLVFFWKAGVFLPEIAAPLCVAAMLTCSLKYSMKENVLRQGYSLGSTPIFFSVFLFYLLDSPPLWPTLYAALIVVVCLLPIRYPITSHVTTHWRFGWKSLTNYSTVILFLPVMIWLKSTWGPVLWAFLAVILVQVVMYPILLKLEWGVHPGFDRSR